LNAAKPEAELVHLSALFCAIGLLATINVILRFPDLAAIIAQYSQF
jgi:hypothetical protein